MSERDSLAGKAERLLTKRDSLSAMLRQMCDKIYFVDRQRELLYGFDRSGKEDSAFEVCDLEQYLQEVSHEQQGRLRQAIDLMLRGGGSFTVEFQAVPDGMPGNWYECIGIPLPPDETGEAHFALALKDITARKMLEEELVLMAFHDPLTELPNRRLFQVHLNQSLAYAKRNRQLLAVLSLDVDDFKNINDSYGHEAGDEFLIAFAKRVKRCVREVDMFARMGGDEFSILLPKIDSVSSVHIVTNRILSAIRQGWELGDRKLSLTASMGVAIYPHDGQDADTLLRNVDAALYRVKAGGRDGCSFYDEAM
ncbi:GGDEF domain-containing protein [Paenibacillus hamazuiensis]|uniref:GGDEF domain-containing protein n=1 Tax=Paenibacillus hamazuiensis TaxID=2936508 RepID=UPI00200CCDDE|nr:GGDEF domain-containing protein [Paenibacillus hamazuiensis]